MKPRVLKCVVWDLDHTIWHGVLAEGDTLSLRSGVADLVRELDARGVLQSIASRNEAVALEALQRFGLHEYFLIPELGTAAKSLSIQRIASRLGIAVDSIVFIDDEAYERAEVLAVHQDMICIDPSDAAQLLCRADLVISDGIAIDDQTERLLP